MGAITRKSIIDAVGFDLDDRGDIAVRIQKVIMDGDAIIFKEPHRVMLQAGDDIDAVMSAVNGHLAAMDFPAVPAEDIVNLKADASRRWTPARKQARAMREQAVRAAGSKPAR